MRARPIHIAISPEEVAALQSSAKPLRIGFAVMSSVATLCTAFSVALLAGGAAEKDKFLLALFAFPALGCIVEAVKMKRQLSSIADVLKAGMKAVHRTRVERVGFQGGTTNPHYNLTLEGIGTLRYRPVAGLPQVELTALGDGLEVEVHLAGDPALFLRVTPNPSIERTCPGKPGHASHVKR
jgi:hypothetical protein